MSENSNSAGIQSLNSSSAPSITWLTLKEACDFLGVHYTTLRSWADKGEISVFRTPGGHRRFSLADLRRFLDERAGHGNQTNPLVLVDDAVGVQCKQSMKIGRSWQGGNIT